MREGKTAVKRGIMGINRSYGRAQHRDAATAGAERPGGRGSARPASPVCYILYEIYNKKDHLYIYYYISSLLIVIYYIYSPFPLFLLPFQLQVSGTPLLWLQSDLWYSPIAVFKIALKIKKDLCGFIRKSLELEKSPTKIVSISIIPHFRSDCKKNTPSRSQRYFSRERI